MTPLELADACEKATAEDQREMLERAFYAIHAAPDFGTPARLEWVELSRLFHRFIDVGAWADAAQTLVPEGCGWIAGWGQTRANEPMGGAQITRNARFIGHDANYDAIAWAEAATPALALCAAALRAGRQG